MKRLFLALLMMAFLFTGCKVLNEYVATDTGAAVIKKAGKIAGIAVGFERVEDIDKIIERCDSLLEEKNEGFKKAALEMAYAYIYDRYGQNLQTALLMSEATDLIGIVLKGNKLSFTDIYDFTAMDMFIVAFRDGLSLATPRHTKFIRK